MVGFFLLFFFFQLYLYHTLNTDGMQTKLAFDKLVMHSVGGLCVRIVGWKLQN